MYPVKPGDIVEVKCGANRTNPTVNDLCFALHDLLEDRVMNPLTNAECGTLYKGLKIRMDKYIDNRRSRSLPPIACRISHLNFKQSGGVILELTNENIDNDISYLLTRLLSTKPILFTYYFGDVNFARTSLKPICNHLYRQSNSERLTKPEMSLVIHELEARMAPIRLLTVKFTHIMLSRKDCKIKEDFESNDFTYLLERLHYNDSHLFNANFIYTDVYTLINNLKKFI